MKWLSLHIIQRFSDIPRLGAWNVHPKHGPMWTISTVWAAQDQQLIFPRLHSFLNTSDLGTFEPLKAIDQTLVHPDYRQNNRCPPTSHFEIDLFALYLVLKIHFNPMIAFSFRNKTKPHVLFWITSISAFPSIMTNASRFKRNLWENCNYKFP